MRYFLDTVSGTRWEWTGREMRIELDNGQMDESIFGSPHDIMTCCNVIETDENGEELKLSPSDSAAAKGDDAFKISQTET